VTLDQQQGAVAAALGFRVTIPDIAQG